MNITQLRQLAINLLDDEHGISEDAYDGLLQLIPTGAEEIFAVVEACEGRYFLPEDHGILA